MLNINNMPDYASEYKYIVANRVDNELWFYGAYNSMDKAENSKRFLEDGVILENDN